MNAAEAIVKCLLEEHVSTVFGYPGGAVLPLYEALRKSELSHILVRQEQAAVHAANGFARVSGQVGVCIGTSGPGATNLITGIATAYMDSIPLVVFTGQVRSNLIGRDIFQEVDITGASQAFTKHNWLVRNAEDLPRIIKEAFHIARTGRPGPVLIDIPTDVQLEKVKFTYPKDVSIRGYKPTEKGHAGQIKRALKLLRESKRPMIFAGGGVMLGKAQRELQAFVEKSRIPLVHTLMGIGCIPTDHPNYIGMIGSHGFNYANKAMAKCDVLVFMGARIADRAIAGAEDPFFKGVTIIHVDVDPAEIGKNVGAHVPVVGDVKSILHQLIAGIEPLETDAWMQEIAAIREKCKPDAEVPSDVINPKLAIRKLSALLDDDAVVVADVGQNQFWTARHLKMFGERRFLCSGGFGTMGYSIPAAEGAKFAAPDRQVLAVMGDGSFQMSMYELGTIAGNQIGIKLLLFNNGRLGMVREMQGKNYGKDYGILLSGNPDFVKVFEAYGMKAVRISRNEDLDDALQEMLAHEGPYLLECLVHVDESTL